MPPKALPHPLINAPSQALYVRMVWYVILPPSNHLPEQGTKISEKRARVPGGGINRTDELI